MISDTGGKGGGREKEAVKRDTKNMEKWRLDLHFLFEYMLIFFVL